MSRREHVPPDGVKIYWPRTQRGRQGSNSKLKKNGGISRAGKAVSSMMEGCPLRREAVRDVLKNAVEKLAKRPTGLQSNKVATAEKPGLSGLRLRESRQRPDLNLLVLMLDQQPAM